jgi:hypothetical protein
MLDLKRTVHALFTMVNGSKQKYGLTRVVTERSMEYDVVSLAGYSIRRGPVSLSRD